MMIHSQAVRGLRRKALRDAIAKRGAAVYVKYTGRINGKFASYFRVGTQYKDERLILQNQRHRTEATVLAWASSHRLPSPTLIVLPKVSKVKPIANVA